jgi:hypothetical protein
MDTQPLRKPDLLSCVKFNQPEWYLREDWMKFVKSSGVATWHNRLLTNPDEYSDVFFTYDSGEGSHWGGTGEDSIPKDIWELLKQELGEGFYLVWITNWN